MTLDELIQQGWAEHEPKSADVADRLEAHVDLVVDDDGAAAFMNLVGHTVGDHLGDRPRARRLCEAAVERLGDEPGPGPLLYLTVARRMAGDEPGAAEAQGRMGAEPDVGVRVDMITATSHMHGGDFDAAAALYGDALARADALPEGHGAERATAITSNNIASELLGLPSRDETQDALMEKAAKASRTYWLRIGDWVNDERGDYLLSGVCTALGRPGEGRLYAERALQTIMDNGGGEPVDQAFLHLARAAACRDQGALDDHKASLAEAEALADNFESDGLKRWFAEELAKAQ